MPKTILFYLPDEYSGMTDPVVVTGEPDHVPPAMTANRAGRALSQTMAGTETAVEESSLQAEGAGRERPHLDRSYVPAFSPEKDPALTTVAVLDGKHR